MDDKKKRILVDEKLAFKTIKQLAQQLYQIRDDIDRLLKESNLEDVLDSINTPDSLIGIQFETARQWLELRSKHHAEYTKKAATLIVNLCYNLYIKFYYAAKYDEYKRDVDDNVATLAASIDKMRCDSPVPHVMIVTLRNYLVRYAHSNYYEDKEKIVDAMFKEVQRINRYYSLLRYLKYPDEYTDEVHDRNELKHLDKHYNELRSMWCSTPEGDLRWLTHR